MRLSHDRRTLTTRLIVRTYELDGFRHVNNAVFVQYLEAARGDYIRAVGLEYAKFHEWAAYPVVTRVEVDYEAPATADEELEFTLRLSEVRRTQFTMQYEVVRVEDGTLIARAETRHAFIHPTGKPIRVPVEFREAFGLSE